MTIRLCLTTIFWYTILPFLKIQIQLHVKLQRHRRHSSSNSIWGPPRYNGRWAERRQTGRPLGYSNRSSPCRPYAPSTRHNCWRPRRCRWWTRQTGKSQVSTRCTRCSDWDLTGLADHLPPPRPSFSYRRPVWGCWWWCAQDSRSRRR